jgi:hypothetical protein
MTKEQMMIPAPAFTEGNQITRVKLQLRVKVEGFDMMNLQSPAFMTAGRTSRLTQEMLLPHSLPLGTAFMPMMSGYVRSMISSLYSPFPMTVCPPRSTPGRSLSLLYETKSSDEYKYHQ